MLVRRTRLRSVIARLAAAAVGTGLLGAAGVAVAPPGIAVGPPFPVGSVFIGQVSPGASLVRVAPDGSQSTFSPQAGAFAVAVDPAGDVFANDIRSQVLEYPAGGGVATVLTGVPAGHGLAVDATGNLYVADPAHHQVLRVPLAGGSRTTVGAGLVQPDGVAVDPLGNVYITDSGTNSAVRVPAGGGPQTTIASGLGSPTGVTVTPRGDLYVAERQTGDLLKFPAGGGPSSAVVTGLGQPDGVAVDASGNVFVTSSADNRVVVVPAAGGPTTTIGQNLTTPTGVAAYAPPPTFRGAPVAPAGTVGLSYPGVQFQVDVPPSEPSPTFSVVNGQLPPGLSINAMSGQISGSPTKAGSYQFQIEAANAATASVSTPVTLTVGKGTQTITFTSSPPAHPKAGDTYQIRATGGGSGNVVAFALDSASTAGSCTVTVTGLVTFGGIGVCVIDADQGGNADYTAAPRVTQSITVQGPGFVRAVGPDRSGDTAVPASVGTNPSGVTSLAAGYDFSLAVASGGVVGWGANDLGQTTVPAAARSHVTAVAATSGGGLALTDTNTLVEWGFHAPPIPAGLSGSLAPPISAITGENVFYLALAGGAVTEWGAPDKGFGIGAVPAAAKSAVIAVDSGTGHALALKDDGSVIAWGANNAGQATVPAAAGSFVTAIAAGGNHSLALKNDHTIVAWGDNTYGESTVPAAAQGKTIAIAAGASFSAALLFNGTILTWGSADTTATIPNLTDGSVPVALAAGDRHLLVLQR